MPFNEIQFGDQHSQKMQIQYVRDNYLRCFMPGYGGKYVKSTVTNLAGQTATQWESPKYSVDVSRPDGLRRMDYDGKGEYSWVDVNTRKILDGDNKGEVETVEPKYKVGGEVYVTKLIADPTNTSGNEFSIELYNPTTVDIFVDENREGRNWSSMTSGSGGMPSGYGPKCIVFCEDGEEISGQILFKTGCSDTDEGQAQAAVSNVEPPEVNRVLDEGMNVALYWGANFLTFLKPPASLGFVDEDGTVSSVGTAFWNSIVYDDVGVHNGELRGAPDVTKMGQIASIALGWWSGKHLSDIFVADSVVDGWIEVKQLADDGLFLSTTTNWAAVNLPSGTITQKATLGRNTYTIPTVGSKISIEGGGKFAASPIPSYYLYSDVASSGGFGCGTYFIGVKTSGDEAAQTGIVAVTGWVKPSPKCEITPTDFTALASVGNTVLTLGCEGGDIEKKVPSVTVYGKGSSSISETSFSSAGVPDPGIFHTADGEAFNYNSGICLVSNGAEPPSSSFCTLMIGNEPQGGEFAGGAPFDGLSSYYGDFNIEFTKGTVNQEVVGYNKNKDPIYSWIPAVGITGLLRFNWYSDTYAAGTATYAQGLPQECGEGVNAQCRTLPGHLAHRIVDNRYYAFKSDLFAPADFKGGDAEGEGRNQCADGKYNIGAAINPPPGQNLAGYTEAKAANIPGYDVSARWKSIFYLKLAHVGWEVWYGIGPESHPNYPTNEQGYNEIVKVVGRGKCAGTPYGRTNE